MLLLIWRDGLEVIFSRVMFHRVAPVQVNYLGYFASTGNPSIDVWVGDLHCFQSRCRNGTQKPLFEAIAFSLLGSPMNTSRGIFFGLEPSLKGHHDLAASTPTANCQIEH